MNRVGKIMIYLIAIFCIITTIGCNVLRPDCEIKKVWEIQNYKIIEKRCIGLAGPHYYPVYLYKDNKEIDYVNSRNDSCVVSFNNQDAKTIQFDLCSMKIIESD